MFASTCGSTVSEIGRMQREDVTPLASGDLDSNEERAGRVFGASEEEIKKLEADLQLRLQEWGPVLTAGQRLLVWERPLPSLLTAGALHGTFWLFSYLSLRPFFLISLFLFVLLGLERWKPFLLSYCKEPVREDSSSDSESLAAVGGAEQHRLLSVSELCHCIVESWLTSLQYMQELQLYKRQNPGKFCAVICLGCAALAVLGHYVPGIMISYIILLSILLWPLVVYRELIQKMYTTLEPLLMKLDYSMKGERLPRTHKKRQTKKEPEEGQQLVAETDSESEIELSGFSPEMDVRITALALSITDSELSDEEASILESGGFSVSRATTPQLADMAEDFDSPNTVTEGVVPPTEPTNLHSPPLLGHKEGDCKPLPEAETQPLLSPPLTLDPKELLPTLASPLHFVNTHFNGKGQAIGHDSEIHALSAGMVSSVIANALQSPLVSDVTLEHALPEAQEQGEAEDFELLEPGELDLMQKELEEAERQKTGGSLTSASSQIGEDETSSS
ncbi:reticulophagy regulator 2 [Bombina bombina]|uniref:reticulophagy regulator 2 n=1 Tax=Bombina bombina TaxID=8345 RepID=UPI00235AE124|nr:reticulophagy regulator 2 [Bombina bombina]